MKTKRLAAILLALVLVFGLGATAFAGTDDGTITVKNVGALTKLDLYQILSSEANTGGGYNYAFVKPEYRTVIIDFITAKDSTATFTDASTPTDILLYLHELDSAQGATLAGLLRECITANSFDATYTEENGSLSGKTMTFAGVATGYYLVEDVTAYVAEEINRNLMLADADPTAEITLKTSTYTPPTKVKPIDSPDSVAVGDVVPYTVTIEVPNYSLYNTPTTEVDYYNFKLVDTMGVGLDYNYTDVIADGVSVTLNGDAFTAYTVTVDPDTTVTGRTILTVDFGDITGLPIGGTLVVSYSATINEDAPYTGEIGNEVIAVENNVDISNEYNTVKVYTYGFDLTKVNEDQTPLAEVEFGLYNETALVDGEYVPVYLKFVKDSDGIYVYDKTGVAPGATTGLTTGADGKIKVRGLRAGSYLLRETDTLDGYNLLLTDVVVTLGGDEAPLVLTLANIVNYTGIILPSTGGIGTALFTVIGGMMIVCSGAVLAVNRKRVFGK